MNHQMQILNNYLHDNGETAIGGGVGSPTAPATRSTASGILVSGNTVDHNNYVHFNPGFRAGIKISYTTGGAVRDNVDFVSHQEVRDTSTPSVATANSSSHFDSFY